MLKVHLSDGETLNVDLGDANQAQAWLNRLQDRNFQQRITALTVAHKGVQYSLPRPRGFDSVSYFAENVPVEPASRIKGGERVVCLAGEVKAVVMVHREQRAVRLSLLRIGKQRYNPGYQIPQEGTNR